MAYIRNDMGEGQCWTGCLNHLATGVAPLLSGAKILGRDNRPASGWKPLAIVAQPSSSLRQSFLSLLFGSTILLC
jgi:hypothetical protein